MNSLGRAATAALLIVTAMVAVASSHGATYYVGPAGSDAGNGQSEKAAFATLAKGLSALKAGDTLVLLPGEYFGANMATLEGAPDAPITIRAQRRGTALVRGDVDVSGFQPVEGLRGVYATAFTRRAEGVADRRRYQVLEPKENLEELELSPSGYYQDDKAGRLYIRLGGAEAPGLQHVTVSLTNGFGIGLIASKHVIVDGINFTGFNHREYGTLKGSRMRWGLYAFNSENITLRHCVSFLNSGGICILSCRKSVIEHCESLGNFTPFQGVANQILSWASQDCVIRHCRAEALRFDDTGSRNDITFYSNNDKVNLLENNLVINGGFMVKGGAKQVIQRGNVSAGVRPAFYERPDASNLMAKDDAKANNTDFADPINRDYRLQSDSPLRGTGPDGTDPGPFPYRDEVFFVSPTGNDNAQGTSLKRAWRTLTHAARRAKPGDTIYVTAGVYAETLAPATSGTEEKPIRFCRRGEERVVLDGQGRLGTGIDLSGRSHIIVEGFALRGFTSSAIRAARGAGVSVQRVAITAAGDEGISVSEVDGFSLSHTLVRGGGKAALRMEKSPDATIKGNVFDVGGGAGLLCDAATLASLWSDYNAFALASDDAALAFAGDTRHARLADWQKATGLDQRSLAHDPGGASPASEKAGLALAADSAFIGRGPLGRPNGPFLSMTVSRPIPVENARVDSVTATTANLECLTLAAPAEVTLEWGDSPNLGGRITGSQQMSHSLSLVGLQPGKTYFYRFSTPATYETVLFAMDRAALGKAPGAVKTEAARFTTPKDPHAPRTLHVAATGDDARSGLSPDQAWRTISRAAEQARAGDTVLIHAGEYEEHVRVWTTGDAGAPITFRAAPGGGVWLTGSKRKRATAFSLFAKHHIHIDGLRFRDFLYRENGGVVIDINGGSDNAARRCFYDGRVLEGYMPAFLSASESPRVLVENCVIIRGMGEGLSMGRCPDAVVRHCVFYNNNIRALTVRQWDPNAKVTLSHNLYCDVIPGKGGSGFVRTMELYNLHSDHNGYFARKGPDQRAIVDPMYIGGKDTGVRERGTYRGRHMLLAEVQAEAGQEKHSLFGNPGMPVVKELIQKFDEDGSREDYAKAYSAWLMNELHQTRQEIKPLDFADFFADPAGPFGRSAAGKPIGLDPAAFRQE